MFSSDPVWMEAAVQRSEDRPQQQNGHQGLPAGRILHGFDSHLAGLSFYDTFISTSLVSSCATGKSQAPVFDVFEAFINTDNIQVFANAATDYIMCLMKFIKGLGLWTLESVCLV